MAVIILFEKSFLSWRSATYNWPFIAISFFTGHVELFLWQTKKVDISREYQIPSTNLTLFLFFLKAALQQTHENLNTCFVNFMISQFFG